MLTSKLTHWVFAIVLSWGLNSTAHANNNPDLEKRLSLADARHLISRTGLGTSIEEINFLAGQTRRTAINYIIDGFTSDPHFPMPDWTTDPAPLYWTRQDLESDEKQRFDRRRDAEIIELRQWWVDTMLATRSPQTERMVLFWHDHFATSYHGVNRQSKAMAMQNQTFRQHALGNFRLLLKAMLRDPALLNFLDNLSNRKTAPNENLARELLELFTLGEGNYSEATVREAARALTGFGVSQNKNLSFEFQSWNFDPSEKELFSKSGHFDGDDLIDLILQQPAVSKHIASKFWHAFISDQPPSLLLLESLATAFRNSDFDIAVLYRTILEHDSFWSNDARAAIVKSPVQLLIGTARSLDYPKNHHQQLPSLLVRTGMDLFAPPNVAGWPDGSSWITSGRLLNRYAGLEAIAFNSSAAPESMNMMADNAMANMMVPTYTEKKNQPDLQLHLAAEEYHGPANYQVQLLTENDEPLWDSGKLELTGGHETTRFGRIKDLSNLPWQVVSLPVSEETLRKAKSMRVHFLNDAGGQDGDRNLFVRGATIGTTWHDTSTGRQQSKCPPKSNLNSGRLYCQGHVSVPLQNNAYKTPQSNHTFYAASSHITWIRAEGDKLDLTLTLQDFYAQGKYYPTYAFHLHSEQGRSPRLEVNSFGCWPDCVEQWPDCAWTNNHSQSRKTLAFPLKGAVGNRTLECHYQSITEQERQIIESLYKNAPALLKEAVTSPRQFSHSQKTAIEHWINILDKNSLEIQQQFKDRSAIIIDENVRQPEKPLQTPVSLQPYSQSLTEVEKHLANAKLTLAEVLLPGISTQQLPEFEKLTTLPINEQLQFIFEHPAFQLH